MTPAARVQSAIEILATWLDGSDGLDRILAAWGRAHRFAGSGDRRSIADLAYDAVRRRRSAAWVAGGSEDSARDLVRGAAILRGDDPAALFDGSRHGPAPLTAAEDAPARDLDDAPRAVRVDIPDWLVPHLAACPEADLASLRERAPVDLRANLLKTDRAGAAEALAGEEIVAEPVELSETALRVTEGARRIAASRAYRGGLVELQDAASQAVADLAAPERGSRVLDLCAGGGGKALALAALAGGRAAIFAHDIDPARMADLGARATRAGAEIATLATDALAAAAPFDLVLVDAPCSGSGAWRRNPDAKWRLTPDRLSALTATQDTLLAQAAGLLAPGGRLVYATCSILNVENAGRTDAFLADHLGWREAERREISLAEGGDGFFAAVLVPDGASEGGTKSTSGRGSRAASGTLSARADSR